MNVKCSIDLINSQREMKALKMGEVVVVRWPLIMRLVETNLRTTARETEALPHPPHSPDLSPTDYHFFKHLDNSLQEEIFKNGDSEESAFREFAKFRNPGFYVNGINKLVLR